MQTENRKHKQNDSSVHSKLGSLHEAISDPVSTLLAAEHTANRLERHTKACQRVADQTVTVTASEYSAGI